MLDSIESMAAKRAQEYLKKVNFEYIFWFEKKSNDKHKYLLSEYNYSIIDDAPTSHKIEYDMYFAGWDGGRIELLNRIYKIAKCNNIKSFFRINGVKKNDIQSVNDIKYNTVLDYKEVVTEAKKANCILEILRSVQNFPTLRYNEAVCYNKKLLTNNKDIVNLPFYDSRYMKVFEKPEDIDWEWVKKRENIDYGYDGRFSPVRLIDKIIELEKEKEGC